MIVRSTTTLFVLFLLIFLVGCSGGSTLQGGLRGSSIGQESTGAACTLEGFRLNVLPETFIDGATIESAYLTKTTDKDGVLVEVHAAGAQGLKAFMFELAYDAGQYTPVECIPANVLAGPDDLLKISYLDERGKVYHGQVIVHFEDATGINGDAVMAEVRFAKMAFTGSKSGSRVAMDNWSRPKIITSYDPLGPPTSDTYTLSWSYRINGDYDGDSEVTIADLVPLSKWIGYKVEDGSHFCDGDHNGEVNVSDITAIGVNFKANVAGFRVYHSNWLKDWPEDNGGPCGEGASVLANRSIDQDKQVSVSTSSSGNNFYWIRPVDRDGNEGTPSWVRHDWGPVINGISAYGKTFGPEPGEIDKEYNENDVTTVVRESGNDVYIDLYASGKVPVQAVSAEVHFDQDMFDPQGVSVGEGLAAVGQMHGVNAIGKNSMVWKQRICHAPQGYIYRDGGLLVTFHLVRQESSKDPIQNNLSLHCDEITPVLELTDSKLYWFGYMPGDMDTNGEVNIQDLNPLGANFGTTGEFPIHSYEYACDFNHDSSIDWADFSSQLMFMGMRCWGYRVYGSMDESDIPDSGFAPSTIEPIIVNPGLGEIDPLWERYPHVYEIESPQSGMYYWVRPYAEYSTMDGVIIEEGPPSNIVQYNGE